jgi:hypothetical protein
MHGVAKAKQKFGKIGAVLPGDAGKQRNPPFRILNRHLHSDKSPGLPDRQLNGAENPQHIELDQRVTIRPMGKRPVGPNP